jgi:hypothetical protein
MDFSFPRFSFMEVGDFFVHRENSSEYLDVLEFRRVFIP